MTLACPVKFQISILTPGRGGGIWATSEGRVSVAQRPYAVQHQYKIWVFDFHVHSTVSASANPPSSGPTFSDLMSPSPWAASSTSFSSDIQPSEIFGILSCERWFVLSISRFVDIFARTSWYRSSLASWAGNDVVGCGGALWGTSANISTRWLHVQLVLYRLWTQQKSTGPGRLVLYFATAEWTYFDVCATTFCKASFSRCNSCGSACITPAFWSPKLPYWFEWGSSKSSLEFSSLYQIKRVSNILL